MYFVHFDLMPLTEITEALRLINATDPPSICFRLRRIGYGALAMAGRRTHIEKTGQKNLLPVLSVPKNGKQSSVVDIYYKIDNPRLKIVNESTLPITA